MVETKWRTSPEKMAKLLGSHNNVGAIQVHKSDDGF